MAADETGAQLQQQQHWGWTRRAEGDCNSRLTVSQPVVVAFPSSLFLHYLPFHLSLCLIALLVPGGNLSASVADISPLVEHFKMLYPKMLVGDFFE